MESKITLTSSDDIAFVTLVNEARANSIDKAFCDELLAVLREVEGASKYRAVKSTTRSGSNALQV